MSLPAIGSAAEDTPSSSLATPTPTAAATVLSCLYCQANIHFVGLPAQRYVDHLFKEHNIMFDVDTIVERTLSLQFPAYRSRLDRVRSAPEKLMLEVAVQAERVPLPTLTLLEPEPYFPFMTAAAGPLTPTLTPAVPDAPTRVATLQAARPSRPAEITSPMVVIPVRSRASSSSSSVSSSHASTTTSALMVESESAQTVGPVQPVAAENSVSVTSWTPSSYNEDQEPRFDDANDADDAHQVTPPDDLQGADVSSPPNSRRSSTESSGAMDVGEPNESPNSLQEDEAMLPPPPVVKRGPGRPKKIHLSKSPSPSSSPSVLTPRLRSCSPKERERLPIQNPEPPASSGLSPSPTASPSRSQSPKLTRSSSATPLTAGPSSPSSKRASATPHDKIVAPSSSSSSPLTSVTFNVPWYAGCEYLCRACRTMFFYIEDLRKHVLKQHGSVDRYLDQYEQFETKAVYLECSICFKNLKRNYQSMVKHLSNAHGGSGMTLETYAKRFNLKDYRITANDVRDDDAAGDDRLVKPEPGLCATKRGSVPADLEGVSTPKKSREQEIDGEAPVLPRPAVFSREEFDAWKDQCRYLCRICDFKCSIQNYMINHVKQIHRIETSQYKEKYGDMAVKVVRHSCLICSKKILWSFASLRSHFKMHSMKVVEYYKKHVVLGKKKNGEQKEGRKISHLALKEHVKWANQCTYHCEECNFMTKRRTAIRNHIKKAHKGPISLLFKKCQKKMVRVKCKICNSSLDHDLIPLANHMNKLHAKLDMKTYYERYVRGTPDEKIVDSKRNQEKPRPSPGVNVVSDEVYNSDDLSLSTSSDGANKKTDSNRSSARRFSIWANQCRYRCYKCDFNTVWRMSLGAHMKQAHGPLTKSEIRSHVDSLAVIRKVQCAICLTSITHDYSNLSAHVKQHNLGLSNYYDEYVVGKQEDSMGGDVVQIEAEPSPERGMESEIEVSVVDDNGENLQDVPVQSEEASEGTSSALPHCQWSNQCQYRCHECSFSTVGRTSINRHFKTAHKTLGKEEVHDRIDKHSTLKMVQCAICSAVIRHDYSNLAVHMHSKHSRLSVREYYEKYVVGKVDGVTGVVPRPSVPDQVDGSLVGSGASVVVEGDGGQVATTTPKQRNATPGKRRVSCKAQFPWDQCQYSCLLCGKQGSNRQVIYNHLYQQHKDRHKEDGCAMRCDGRRSHTCRLCHKAMACETNTIRNHLKNTHDTTLENYEDLFRDDLEREFARVAVENGELETQMEAEAEKVSVAAEVETDDDSGIGAIDTVVSLGQAEAEIKVEAVDYFE